MPIAVTCPKCSATFRVKDKYAGSSRGCTDCGATIWVPTADALAAEDRATRDDIEPLISGMRETEVSAHSTVDRSPTPDAPAVHAFDESSANDGDATPSPGVDGRIRFYCNGCGKRLKVKSQYAGGQTKCDDCGEVVNIPRASVTPSTPPSDEPSAEPAPGPRDSPPPHAPSLVSEGFEDLLDDKIEVRRELPHGYKVSAPQVSPKPVVQMAQKKKRRHGTVETGEGGGWTLGGYLKYRLIMTGVGFLCVGIMYLAAHFGFDIRPTRMFGLTEEHPALGIMRQVIAVDRQTITLLESVNNARAASAVSSQYAELTVRRDWLSKQYDSMIGGTISDVDDMRLDRLRRESEQAVERLNAQVDRVSAIPGCWDIMADALAKRGVGEKRPSSLTSESFPFRSLLDAQQQDANGMFPGASPPEIPSFDSARPRRSEHPFAGVGAGLSSRGGLSARARQRVNRQPPMQNPVNNPNQPRLDALWEQAQVSDERLDLALRELDSPIEPSRLRAMQELAEIAPTDEHRDEIVRAVQGFLGAEDANLRKAAVGVFLDWHQGDTVGVLLDAIRASNESSARSDLIETVGTFEDERIADAMAALLVSFTDRRAAGIALRQIGPAAEEAVLRQLRKPDPGLQREACEILAEIGTRRSLSALRRLRRSRSSFLSQPAGSAIFAIQLRESDDSGSPAPAAASESKDPAGR